MFNEIKVREVKAAIARQHSALKDLQIQTLVRSLSLMCSLHKHNLRSRLAEFASRHTSSDTVGDDRRQMMRSLMERNDPFNFTRGCVTDWELKSKGSPFAGLTVQTMSRFLNSTRDKFMLWYPDQ